MLDVKQQKNKGVSQSIGEMREEKTPRIIGLAESNTMQALQAKTEQKGNADWLFSSALHGRLTKTFFFFSNYRQRKNGQINDKRMKFERNRILSIVRNTPSNL